MAESLDLEAIRARAAANLELPLPDLQWIAHAVASAADVAPLLAEVERLTLLVKDLATAADWHRGALPTFHPTPEQKEAISRAYLYLERDR